MAEFVTPEAARERFRALADQVDAAYDQMRALSSDGVGNEFRTELAERLEFQDRTNRGLMYRVFGEMADPPDEAVMAPVLVNSVAARLRIPPREIKRRMKTAARIRPRRQLCGPPLAPELDLVAHAVEAGTIGEDHLRVISRAIDRLPSCVSMTDRGDVETSLVREAAKNDAEIVKAVAGRIDEIFNPDGDYDEADRGPAPRPGPGGAGTRRDVATLGIHRPRNPQLCRGRHRRAPAVTPRCRCAMRSGWPPTASTT
jgi:hypothetical protein